MVLKSLYPYAGGKSTIVGMVWSRLGNPKHYIEPFFGSGAMLLGRPDYTFGGSCIETVNDQNGFISNFWRAIK